MSSPRRRKTLTRPPVGWREWVSLPELGIDRIKAKVDTGARTAALHAVRIRHLRINGVDSIRFDVHPLQRRARPLVTCEAALVDERYVRSSDGQRELRPVISTCLGLGEDDWPIELSLTNRAQMGFRLLLGRRAVRGRFVVDPGRSWIRSER